MLFRKLSFYSGETEEAFETFKMSACCVRPYLGNVESARWLTK